jgi:hypothetical protein
MGFDLQKKWKEDQKSQAASYKPQVVSAII